MGATPVGGGWAEAREAGAARVASGRGATAYVAGGKGATRIAGGWEEARVARDARVAGGWEDGRVARDARVAGSWKTTAHDVVIWIAHGPSLGQAWAARVFVACRRWRWNCRCFMQENSALLW